MKKMCVMLAIVICFSFGGCKKTAPPSSQPKPPGARKEPFPAAAEVNKSAPSVLPAAERKEPFPATVEANKAAVTEQAAKPAAEQTAQSLSSTAAAVDLTSPIDKLKEQVKSMDIDALKATAEKYKAQFMTLKNELATKTDLLNKIPLADKLGPDAQSLTKDIQTITSSMSSIKERMGVYVDALKAKGIDISSFAL